MDLTTRCPQCGETFSASLDQLQLRKGYIRCINCAHIFDGYEAVVPKSAPNTAPESRVSAAPKTVPGTAPNTVGGKAPNSSSPATAAHVASAVSHAQASNTTLEKTPTVPQTAEGMPKVLRRPPKRYTPEALHPDPSTQSGAAQAAPFTISESALPTAGSEPVLGESAALSNYEDPSFSMETPASLRPDPTVGPPHENDNVSSSHGPGADPRPQSASQYFPPVNASARTTGFTPESTTSIRPSAARPTEPTFSHAQSSHSAEGDRQREAFKQPLTARSASSTGIYVEPRRTDEPDKPPPDFLEEVEDRGWSGSMWATLLVIGLIVMAAQLAYLYRNQIAQAAPWTRPVLQQACASLECTVDYARRIDRISIMSSSLQAEAGQDQDSKDRRLILSVVLRNSFEHAQEWPNLTLDLVDVSGTAVVRRILTPQTYLPVQAAQAPFSARSEMHLAIPITVTGQQINGYQLGKYYP